MGQSVTKMVKDAKDTANKNSEERQKQLAMLDALLTNKENEFKLALLKDNTDDKTLPIETIVAQRSMIQVNCSSGASDQLHKAVNDMFGGNFLSALSGLASAALDQVLGSSSAGAKEVRSTTTTLLNNAIVRVDYMMYSYTLQAGGLINEVSNGLVCVATVGIVPVATISVDVFAYLLGDAATQASAYFRNRVEEIENELKEYRHRDITTSEASEIAGKIKGRYRGELTEKQLETLNLAVAATTDRSNVEKLTYDDLNKLQEIDEKQAAKRAQFMMINAVAKPSENANRTAKKPSALSQRAAKLADGKAEESNHDTVQNFDVAAAENGFRVMLDDEERENNQAVKNLYIEFLGKEKEVLSNPRAAIANEQQAMLNEMEAVFLKIHKVRRSITEGDASL